MSGCTGSWCFWGFLVFVQISLRIRPWDKGHFCRVWDILPAHLFFKGLCGFRVKVRTRFRSKAELGMELWVPSSIEHQQGVPEQILSMEAPSHTQQDSKGRLPMPWQRTPQDTLWHGWATAKSSPQWGPPRVRLVPACVLDARCRSSSCHILKSSLLSDQHTAICFIG